MAAPSSSSALEKEVTVYEEKQVYEYENLNGSGGIELTALQAPRWPDGGSGGWL